MSSENSHSQSVMDGEEEHHEELKTLTSLLKNYKKDPKKKKKISLYRKSDHTLDDDASINGSINASTASLDDPQPRKAQTSKIHHPYPPASPNGLMPTMMDGSNSNDSDVSDDAYEDDDHSHVSIISAAPEYIPEVINNPSDMNEVTIPHSGDLISDTHSEFSNIDFPDFLPSVDSPPLQQEKQNSHPQKPIIQSIPQQPIIQSKPINKPQIIPQVTPSFKINRKSVPGQNFGIAPLTVITYNIWYNKRHQSARTRELIVALTHGHKYKPDIISLQEVTPKSYQILEQALNEDYFLFEILSQSSESQVPYSNLIAVNRSTLEIVPDTLTAYDFDSQMGRKLMVCAVKHKATDIQFYVFNAHLESFKENWSYRRSQMDSIIRLIKEEKISNFILTGDFNICDPTEPIESQLRMANYKDAWIEMGSPNSLKYTYNHNTNNYIKWKKSQQSPDAKLMHPPHPSRLDRILYRFRENQALVTKMKLLGVAPSEDPKRPPHPSDHFGVLSEFMIKRNQQ